MRKCPEIAILMATYNGEKYLEEQLNSLLGQTGFLEEEERLPVSEGEHEREVIEFKNAEIENGSCKNMSYKIYIHDDGSNDNTLCIVRKYAEQYPNKIEIIEGPATGSAKNNFFYLMREVTGWTEIEKSCQKEQDHNTPFYYFFCDQDDIWLKDKLRIELDELKRIEKSGGNGHKEPSLVWCDMRVVDDELNEISQSFSLYSNLRPDDLDLDRCIMHGKAAGCSIACNDLLIQKCCEIKEIHDIIMHDWALFLIAKMIGRVKYIKKPLVLYRQHGDNSFGADHEGTLQILSAVVGRLLTMKQLKATQVNLKRYISQVACLKQIKEVYESHQELIDRANEFEKMNRIDRVRYVNKYKLFRHKNTRLWCSLAVFFD